MADSLTGVWDGTFMQPGFGAVTFLATLIEAAGSLSGSVRRSPGRRATPPTVTPATLPTFIDALNAKSGMLASGTCRF